MKKLSKKIVSGMLLVCLVISGCTASSEIVKMQNQEIVELQKIRAEIVARPATTAKQKLEKAADLKMINNQIDQAMKTATEAQRLSNQQTSNSVAGAVTAAGAILGGAAIIHNITK